VSPQLDGSLVGAGLPGVPRARDVHLEDLADPPGARRHQENSITQHDGLVHRMGYEHHGLGLALEDLQQLLLERLPGLGVQGAEGLVHQQHGRVDGQGPGQTRPLLHSARELEGVGVLEAGQADQADVAVHHRRDLAPRAAEELEPVRDVLVQALPRKEPELLEDHRHRPRGRSDAAPVDQHLAGVRRHQPVEHA
jgi:hypothetical protein